MDKIIKEIRDIIKLTEGIDLTEKYLDMVVERIKVPLDQLLKSNWISVEDGQIGILTEAEFDNNTMLFKIKDKMTVRVGEYYIIYKQPLP